MQLRPIKIHIYRPSCWVIPGVEHLYEPYCTWMPRARLSLAGSTLDDNVGKIGKALQIQVYLL